MVERERKRSSVLIFPKESFDIRRRKKLSEGYFFAISRLTAQIPPPSHTSYFSFSFYFTLLYIIIPVLIGIRYLLILAIQGLCALVFEPSWRIYSQELYTWNRPFLLPLLFIFVLFVSCLVSGFPTVAQHPRRQMENFIRVSSRSSLHTGVTRSSFVRFVETNIDE